MKQFTTYPELEKNGPEEVASFVKAIIASFGEDMNDAVDEYLSGDLTLSDFGGGDVFVIESFEDLKQVPALASVNAAGQIVDWLSSEGVREANITDTDSAYDGAEYIADGAFVFIFLATNNAGGNTYYIPRDIADQCPNIAVSIQRAQGE